MKDISDRERAAQELQKSEARLHRALAAARAGTWEWDLATGKNTWSEALWKLYDLDPQSSSPDYDAWLTSVFPDDRAAAAATVTGAAARREAFYAEWRVATQDGSERWLGSHGSPELDDTGKVVRYLGVVIDITRRKLAEDAVHVGEAQRAAAFDSLGDAILITDAQGTLVHFNEAWVTFCRFADRDDCPAAFDAVPWSLPYLPSHG